MECDGNIAPEVYNLLNHLPSEVLHNVEYRKAHPLAIYHESINRILKSFSKILDIYEKNILLNRFPNSEFEELLEEQKELLHSLHSHFDDCNQIIKVTSPYPTNDLPKNKILKKLERSTYRWFEYFENPGFNYFIDVTKGYRTFIGRIVNKIKHEQGRLKGISIKMDQQQCVGYFIEIVGVNKEHSSKLPDTVIHPFGTAFSFSRDLSLHFYKLYEISHYLKKSLEKSFQKYEIQIEYKKIEVDYLDFWSIANRISDLEISFFPDEYSKLHPMINCNERNNIKELTLNLDQPWYKPHIPETVSVYWLCEPDGVTEFSVMPYFDYFLRYLPIESLPKLFLEK